MEEKIKGRLEKWKWLKAHMSYRGRTLVINNMVASALWRRLACMEPPEGLLQRVQGFLVDFFGEKCTGSLKVSYF